MIIEKTIPAQPKWQKTKDFFKTRKKEFLTGARRAFYYGIVIPSIIIFSAGSASAQQKPEEQKKNDVPALLQPLNFTGPFRLSPMAFSAPSQLIYFGKYQQDGTKTNMGFLCFSSTQLQTGIQYSEATKDGKTTKTYGIAGKFTIDALNGKVISGSRFALVEQPDGKTSNSVDIAGMFVQPWELPVIVTVGIGTSGTFGIISTGSTNWATNFTMKSLKGVKSYGIGGDYHITYSGTVSQRFYASYENTPTAKKQVFTIGSRVFFPFGTGELNYELVKNGASTQNNVSVRVSYMLN